MLPQEVALLRTLRHRNIVQFYGACLEPDCFFIVTELMQGALPACWLCRCLQAEQAAEYIMLTCCVEEHCWWHSLLLASLALKSLRASACMAQGQICVRPGQAQLDFSSQLIHCWLCAGGDVYSTLKRCPGLLAWDKLGKRIALDTALGLNYLHSRCKHIHVQLPPACFQTWALS